MNSSLFTFSLAKKRENTCRASSHFLTVAFCTRISIIINIFVCTKTADRVLKVKEQEIIFSMKTQNFFATSMMIIYQYLDMRAHRIVYA